jgi:ubiquinone/menaquinone biosynthesis C-methylase UbiE
MGRQNGLLCDPCCQQSLTGAKFLDLGCGFGWVCRWAREKGAVQVRGVDLSENMLAKARKFPADESIIYLRADLDSLELPPNTYDVAFSSLTFHYLKDLPRLVEGFTGQPPKSLNRPTKKP